MKTILLSVLMCVVAVNVSHAQYNNSTLPPPPPVPDKTAVDKEQKNQKDKIIAKNHQYMGVNNLMTSVYNRKEPPARIQAFVQGVIFYIFSRSLRL